MDVYFMIFAVMAVSAGLLTIGAKEALVSAMGLLTVFISLAALYLHLSAPLVAIFQVAIYAGAILVLIVFVIMLLMSPGEAMAQFQANAAYRTLGAILGLLLMGLLGLGAKAVSDLVEQRGLPEGFGHPSMVGDLFFKDFILHFEVISVLLLVALIGGIYLAKRNVKEDSV